MESHSAPDPRPSGAEAPSAYEKTLECAQVILLSLPTVPQPLVEAMAGPGGAGPHDRSHCIKAAIAAIPEDTWAGLSVEERRLLHIAFIAARQHSP